MKFTGRYIEFTAYMLLFSVLTVLSMGLAFPIQLMWLIKYVVEHTEVKATIKKKVIERKI